MFYEHIDNFSYALTAPKPAAQGYIEEAGFIAALQAGLNYPYSLGGGANNPANACINGGTVGRVAVPVTVVSDVGTVKAVGYLVKWDDNTDNKVYFSSAPDDLLTATEFVSGDLVECRIRNNSEFAGNIYDSVYVDGNNVGQFTGSIRLLADVTEITIAYQWADLDIELPSVERMTHDLSGGYWGHPLAAGVKQRYAVQLAGMITGNLNFVISSSSAYDRVIWESGVPPVFDGTESNLFVEFQFMGHAANMDTWIGRYHYWTPA